MKLDLQLFDMMFPNYKDFRTPMWSIRSEEKNGFLEMEIVVPGYNKEDLNISFESNTLFLDIKQKDKSLHYSIVDSFWAPKYKLEKATAKYKNGILKISIPKIKSKRTKIEVV